uniref:Uncharacterized protein n=1 Tax=Streptomyces sp. NBC_01393 TaxID=2903851 RepID=A0AAU3I242_9ACTN
MHPLAEPGPRRVPSANRLYAASLDKADNVSDRQVYLFYANGFTVLGE